jgi:DNA adenine methylase
LSENNQLPILDPYRKGTIAPLYNKPPLVRKGGKRYLAETITEMINSYDYSMYVEPFFGGGRIYFEKEAHFEEIINDREERIANFFYCCKNFPDEMNAAQATLIKDENLFYRLWDAYHDPKQLQRIREEIQTAWKRREKTTDLINTESFFDEAKQILVNHAIDYYFYANMVFRGGDARNMTYFENDPRTENNRLRYRIFRPLYWLAHRMRRTQILNKDFIDVFRIALKYQNHTRLWYLDPPFWKTEGYEYEFPWEKYELLNLQLKSLPKTDTFILSLNIREEFDELFDWCNFEKVPTRYTTGGAGQSKNVEEYLITPPWAPKVKSNGPLDRFLNK